MSVAFSRDNRLLASKSNDVRIWRCDIWENSAILNEASSSTCTTGVSFSPKSDRLATLAGMDKIIDVWDLDLDKLLIAPPATSSVRYTSH